MDCNISNQGMELDRGIQVRSRIWFRCPKELDMDGTLEVLDVCYSHTDVKGLSLCIDAHLHIKH